MQCNALKDVMRCGGGEDNGHERRRQSRMHSSSSPLCNLPLKSKLLLLIGMHADIFLGSICSLQDEPLICA